MSASAAPAAVDTLSLAMQQAQLSSAHSNPTPPALESAVSKAHSNSPSHASVASTASLSSPSASSHPFSPSDAPSASPLTSAASTPTADSGETDELYGDLSSAAAFFASPPVHASSLSVSQHFHSGLPPLPVLPSDLRSIVKSLQVISSELKLDKSLPALIAIITQQAGASRGIMLSKSDEVNPSIAKLGAGRQSSSGGVEGAEDEEWVVEASASGDVLRDSNGELLNMPPSPLGATAALMHSLTYTSSSAFSQQPSMPNTTAPSPVLPHSSLLSPSSSMSSSHPFSSASSFALHPAPPLKPLYAPASALSSSSASPISPTFSRSLLSHAPPFAPPAPKPYPASLLQYCIRTKKSVLLSDALSDSRFGRDAHITEHSIRSVLCTPLLHRDKLVSILYLESGAPNAFTSERLVVCRLLCQQAAISIDNARLYAQLARSNELLELKVAQRTTELEEATRLANEANRMKSAFLANMSHEIRTPMNGVLGGASLLVETSTNLTVEQKEIVHIIRTSGEVMLTLINDILDLSKIEAGRVELDYTVFSLRSCLEGALDVLAEKASRKHVELLYSAGAGVADMVVGDALRLRQIVINLLSNAVKFTDQGEVLLYVESMEDADYASAPQLVPSRYLDTIAHTFSSPSFSHSTAAPVSSHLPALQRMSSTRPHLPGERSSLYHIAVRDTGIGIPVKQLPNLFQSFSQVSSKEQQRQFGGTGLGLSISRQLCELMGGRMWVESEEGVGSVFHFTFRIWTTTEGSPSYLQGATAELLGKRILVVKDSERPASMIAGMCEQWGMQVTLARNLSEVESLLRAEEHIDVVLVDYELDSSAAAEDGDLAQTLRPRRGESTDLDQQSTAVTPDASVTSSHSTSAAARVTGLDVAQLIRRSFPANTSPTVLMLCALSQRHRSMRTIVDAFLSKPLKPAKLFAALVAAQRPKLSQVMLGAATAAGGSTSPVLDAANMLPLVPLAGWQPIDSMGPPATSKHSTVSGPTSADSSAAMQGVQPAPQPQQANGKRRRSSFADTSETSPPAGSFHPATSPTASSSASASPFFSASMAASPALHSRHLKPARLSSSATGSPSLWLPATTSTSPTLGEDSRLFFAKHPMRILAAEDNLINQKVLARMLDRLGYPPDCVTIVPNGKLAWEGVAAAAVQGDEADGEADGDEDVVALGRRMRREAYHLVFMDILMPVMDGMEATTAIRSDSRVTAATQPFIVALTANAMTGDKQRCLEAGCDFFLSKPVTLGPLMQALRTGYVTQCKKRKQTLARQQREDGSRHSSRAQEADDGCGDGEAAGRGGASSSAVGSGTAAGSTESRPAGADPQRRGAAQTVTSPSVRPSKLAQLGSGAPLHSSMPPVLASPRSAAARLSSATAGTSPISAPSHGVKPQQAAGELPALPFARISSAPLSVLTGRMLSTSQQLQFLANLGYTPGHPPLLSVEGRSAAESSGGGGQMQSALMSTTSKATLSSTTLPSG